MSDFESELHTRALPGGMTRDCTDPWTYIEITTTGDVRPCCARPAVGNLAKQPLAQILNGPLIRKLRENLLAGNPDGACINCRLRAPASAMDLQSKIRLLMKDTEPPVGFEARSYLAANPDVARNAVDPARHFSRSGRFEGRPLFPDNSDSSTPSGHS